jgi:hypothetical protein
MPPDHPVMVRARRDAAIFDIVCIVIAATICIAVKLLGYM